jgi:hypothetical protein
MDKTATLMTITIRKSESGLFFATSEDEPTLFVSAVSAEDLLEATAVAIEKIFQMRNVNVSAIPAERGMSEKQPWAIVPRELIAQASVRAAQLANAYAS